VLETLFDIFFPRTCLNCSERVHTEGLCTKCWQGLTFLDRPACNRCYFQFDFTIDASTLCAKCITKDSAICSIRSPLKYDVFSKEIILRFKNFNSLHIGNLFADLMLRMANEFEIEMVVPVPLHFLRWIWRGYNQSSVLAKLIAEKMQKPVIHDLLIRNRFTTSQGRFRKADREKNIKDAFSVNKQYNISGKRILLIDDVCTTSSTLEECAKTLKRFGAGEVHCLTVAKT
jgi:ComF family protein